MTKTARARYTLELKKEAVQLVEAGQNIVAATSTLGTPLFEAGIFYSFIGSRPRAHFIRELAQTFPSK